MEVDRSPSPAQPPPTPSAPGPRAAALLKLYNDAVTHVLKTCSHHNFSSCFPTPTARVPGAVRHLHEQFISKLGEILRKEFENILVDRNVVPSLNELDRLIEDARKRKSAATAAAAAVSTALADNDDGAARTTAPRQIPPHVLPARQLYIAHLAPSLRNYAERMSAQQEALANENQELIQRVMQQRKDIKALMDGLESAVQDLNGSVAIMQPDQTDALRDQGREADEVTR